MHPEGALADKWAIELPREGRGCECGAAALRPSDEHEAVIVDGDLCGGREAERERKGSQKEGGLRRVGVHGAGCRGRDSCGHRQHIYRHNYDSSRSPGLISSMSSFSEGVSY